MWNLQLFYHHTSITWIEPLTEKLLGFHFSGHSAERHFVVAVYASTVCFVLITIAALCGAKKQAGPTDSPIHVSPEWLRYYMRIPPNSHDVHSYLTLFNF